MDRRRFLQFGTAAGLGVALGSGPLAAFARGSGTAPSVASGQAYLPVSQFPSGVISGDPATDSVVLWTRIDPAVAGAGIQVSWQIGTDPTFPAGSIVGSGIASTAAAQGHTVHVEPSGLDAGTTYWYRFSVGGASSPVGRTKTLPAGEVDRLRLAFFSCERFVHGYYTAHADLASMALDPATDVDLVICLGDYVYEAGPADSVTVAGRSDPDAPQVSLADYRRQYELYRTDLDLQAMHAAYPVVAIFDNHDGMSGPSDPSGPGAVAAFFEQMPVRRNPSEPNRQHRSFALGGLAELFMLDERQYRDPLPPESDNPLGTSSLEEPSMAAPGRTMLGAAQRNWLTDGLGASTAQWKVLGSQLMFAPLRSQRFAEEQQTGDELQRHAGRYVNLIQWDGYQAERQELLDHLHDNEILDVLAIAGDTHFWTTSEVPLDYDDPASPLVLAEFGGSSITSANAGEMTNLPGNDLIRPVVAEANPLTLRYMEAETHGYAMIDLTPTMATVTYRSPADITRPTSASSVLARFEVDQGSAVVRQVEGSGFMARPADVEGMPPTTVPSPGSGAGSVDAPAPAAVPVAGTAGYTG